MAGPNMEVFKFGVYVFFPIAMMVHFGNPEWYSQHVIPYRDKFWPPDAETVRHLPHDSAELRQELEQIKIRRLRAKEAAVKQHQETKRDSETERLV